MLTQLVDRLPAVADYAWNRAVGSNGIAAVLLWLLAIEVAGPAGPAADAPPLRAASPTAAGA